MEDQGLNSCLFKISVPVIKRILSRIPNLTNISRTCKFLYGIVCDMEQCRRVLQIKGTFDRTSESTHLTIDDDGAFDSIMNTHRIINEIRLRGSSSNMELNERQIERMTAIMGRFGASITSLELSRITLSINSILQWLHQKPNLESITFSYGRVVDSRMEETTMLLQLSSLKSLKIEFFDGLSDIMNLIPSGSLNSFYYSGDAISQSTYSTEILETILTTQHKIKSLHICDFPAAVHCIHHLQLETLILEPRIEYNNDDLVKILRSHTDLKELRLSSCEVSASSFEWICNNLKKLEVFEVRLESPDRNVFEMLAELKNLRHFRTNGSPYLFDNRFQYKSESLEKLEIANWRLFGCSVLLNKMVHSMDQTFTNLTDLQMAFDDFFALSFVLSHCSALTHLTSHVRDPSTHQLTQQRWPNIQYLTLSSYRQNDEQRYEMTKNINTIVNGMPNLKSLSLSQLSFNLKLIKEFINGIKRLAYFYVDRFEIDPDLSVDDFVEIIRRLLDQMKGYRLDFFAVSLREFNLPSIKDILSDEFNFRDSAVYSHGSTCFCLYKSGGDKKKVYKDFLTFDLNFNFG